MRIFFLGHYWDKNGPNEVNRNLLSAIKDRVLYIKSRSRIISRVEIILKIIFSRVIICSGMHVRNYELILIHLLRKKMIYIMHGCSLKENGLYSSNENRLMAYSSMILCVSKIYKEQVAAALFPMHKHKMHVLHNPINWEELQSLHDESNTRDVKRIILVGGGRQSKRNLQVCQAVEHINSLYNTNLHVDIYGVYRSNDDSYSISSLDCASFHEIIPHEDLMKEFKCCNIHILNSDFESFGLCAIEALACGCNILLSKNVGASEIIPSLNNTDIINDPRDVNEITTKLLFLLKHDNNERLLSLVDKEKSSVHSVGNELMANVYQLLNKK